MPLDFPNNPVDGQVYDNYYYDSVMGTWRAYGSINLQVPAGIINQYGGSTAPSGYLMCTGQSISTTEYPALFQAIGYTYGGSGANFNVPNLQGRVPVGRDATQTEFDALGEAGGNKTHTLTVNEMPSHTHTQDAHNHTQNSHLHTSSSGSPFVTDLGAGNALPTASGNNYGFRNNGANTASTTATNNATTATNQNTGGGQAHNNLQPYIVLNYIIKT